MNCSRGSEGKEPPSFQQAVTKGWQKPPERHRPTPTELVATTTCWKSARPPCSGFISCLRLANWAANESRGVPGSPQHGAGSPWLQPLPRPPLVLGALPWFSLGPQPGCCGAVAKVTASTSLGEIHLVAFVSRGLMNKLLPCHGNKYLPAASPRRENGSRSPGSQYRAGLLRALRRGVFLG